MYNRFWLELGVLNFTSKANKSMYNGSGDPMLERIEMGKGDKRTKRGKLFRGSTGKPIPGKKAPAPKAETKPAPKPKREREQPAQAPAVES